MRSMDTQHLMAYRAHRWGMLAGTVGAKSMGRIVPKRWTHLVESRTLIWIGSRGSWRWGHAKPCSILACGAGDPRLWIARETGGSLIGIDVSAWGFGGHLAASLPSYMTAILTTTPRDGLRHPWTPLRPILGFCGQGRRCETTGDRRHHPFKVEITVLLTERNPDRGTDRPHERTPDCGGPCGPMRCHPLCCGYRWGLSR